jgi:hypothetical protein
MPRSRHRKKSTRPRRRSSLDRYDDSSEARGGVANALGVILEPYLIEASTPEEVERLLAMGTLAWNVSLLPPSEREREIRRFARKLFPPPRFRLIRLMYWGVLSWVRRAPIGVDRVGTLLDDVAFEKLIHELIERKARLFPHDDLDR